MTAKQLIDILSTKDPLTPVVIAGREAGVLQPIQFVQLSPAYECPCHLSDCPNYYDRPPVHATSTPPETVLILGAT